MRTLRLLTAMAALGFASLTWTDEGRRGSIPPGQSRDGSAPGAGAIKGGAILPGETAGVPEERAAREKSEQRCRELAGTLREDCLRQGRDAAEGASAEASDIRMPKTEPAD
jgi:hypothetical protein